MSVSCATKLMTASKRSSSRPCMGTGTSSVHEGVLTASPAGFRPCGAGFALRVGQGDGIEHPLPPIHSVQYGTAGRNAEEIKSAGHTSAEVRKIISKQI